jgi:hypothetical protein
MVDVARVRYDADRDVQVASAPVRDEPGRLERRHIGRAFVGRGDKARNRAGT